MEVCEQRPANAATSMVLGDTNSDSRPLHFSLTAWGRCLFQRVSLYSKLTIVTLVSHHSLQWPPHPAKRKETCANKPRPDCVLLSTTTTFTSTQFLHRSRSARCATHNHHTHHSLLISPLPTRTTRKSLRKAPLPLKACRRLANLSHNSGCSLRKQGHDFEPVHHSILGSTVAYRLLLEGSRPSSPASQRDPPRWREAPCAPPAPPS